MSPSTGNDPARHAGSLQELGVVDEVIPEPLGGAHYAPDKATAALKYALQKHLNDLVGLDPEKLVDLRYDRYRVLGEYREVAAK